MGASRARSSSTAASLIPERIHRLRGASASIRAAREASVGRDHDVGVFCGHFQVRPELVFQVGVAPAGSSVP